MFSDPLTLIFSIVCLFYAIRGAYFGLTKVLLRIGALIGAYLCAYTGYPPISALLSQHSPIELPAPLYNALAGCLCLLITFILFSIVAACIHKIIKRYTDEWPTNLMMAFVTRIAAALISGVFGFALCLSGLVGYLILSNFLALPHIAPTVSNQAIVNVGERIVQYIDAKRQDVPKETKGPKNKMQPQSIRKSDGIAPSGGLHPLSNLSSDRENILVKHINNPA